MEPTARNPTLRIINSLIRGRLLLVLPVGLPSKCVSNFPCSGSQQSKTRYLRTGLLENHKSQYYGWPRSEINDVIEMFTEIIWRTVSMRIRITVPNVEYEQIFRGKIGPHVDFHTGSPISQP
jgi:hypothetical protein